MWTRISHKHSLELLSQINLICASWLMMAKQSQVTHSGGYVRAALGVTMLAMVLVSTQRAPPQLAYLSMTDRRRIARFCRHQDGSSRS